MQPGRRAGLVHHLEVGGRPATAGTIRHGRAETGSGHRAVEVCQTRVPYEQGLRDFWRVVSDVRRSDVPVRDSSERGFTAFVEQYERPLREALTAAFGIDTGREATADALAHAWQRWDRISTMENPVGYLFVVGRNSARRSFRRRPVAMSHRPPVGETAPSFEPALAGALAKLSERERAVVLLLHGFEWSMSEVAAALGLSKSTVQSYAERALVKLRSRMGVVR